MPDRPPNTATTPSAERGPITFDTAVAPFAPPQSFTDAAAELGIEFDEGDVPRLGHYLAMLFAANEVVNLTAATDPEQAWIRHILDSLTLMAPLSEVEAGGTVIDVGSGGGLPGIPLAICMGHLRFRLLETTGKKAAFLRAAAAALKLKNVEVIVERAEVIAQNHHDHREQYDAVVARAVGPMSVIAELTVPLAKVGTGRVLLIKGQKADEELAAAKQALHLLHAAHAGTIDTPTGRIVVLEKARKTPRDYPRPPGEPKRKPLGE